jgi:hypothetical protein
MRVSKGDTQMNALVTLVSQTEPITTINETSGGSGAFWGTYSIFILAILVITLVAMWKIFVKLGEPGWKGLIPIYNVFKIFELSGKSGWLVLLFLIPCVNIIAAWLLADALGDMFGKSFGYKLGLFIFPGLFHLILGFGSSQPVSVPGGRGGQVPPLAAG